ncbi:MAG: hypothetical protein JWL76_331 [Thermoleophilia bacterium]|nr:hypothetical protein [Thermoleophilia bacterium]
MRPARTSILFALVALLLALPATAMAQGAGEPEMMVDPIEAMEPEVDVADPVAPAGDDVVVQDAVPQAEGIADGAAAEPDRDAASANAAANEPGPASAPAYAVASGSGQLPFTGVGSGQLMLLFLVGSVLLAGGVVSLAWAGARTEMA